MTEYENLLRWREITKKCVLLGCAKLDLWFKACDEVRAYEMRYNHNHDEKGRFCSGDSGAKYSPKKTKENETPMYGDFVGKTATQGSNSKGTCTRYEYAKPPDSLRRLANQTQRVDSGANSGIIENVTTNANGDKVTIVDHVSLKSEPNSITQRVTKNGGIDRNYYGEDGCRPNRFQITVTDTKLNWLWDCTENTRMIILMMEAARLSTAKLENLQIERERKTAIFYE